MEQKCQVNLSLVENENLKDKIWYLSKKSYFINNKNLGIFQVQNNSKKVL